MTVKVWVAPRGVRDWLRDAVVAGGGVVVDDAADATAIVWTSPRDPAALAEVLAAHPHIRWVQLPWSGIEHYLALIREDVARATEGPRRLWTAGQGIYAKDVAEHALTLTLASLRDLKRRATARSWQAPSGRSLHGARVTIFGAGGIARALVPLLAPFAPALTVVRRERTPFFDARVCTLDERVFAVTDADVVIVALALTPETAGVIGAAELAAMKPTTVLVNVARGAHVDSAALVQALETRTIGAAALDVTDPEPLPDDHRLFHLDNCLITPHCANTPEMAVPVLTARVRDNVLRYRAGAPLLGVVDVDAGY